MTEQGIKEADYYHARAADMMARAQSAPSKAIRVAYINLAWIWMHRAETLEREGRQSAGMGGSTVPAPPAAGPEN